MAAFQVSLAENPQVGVAVPHPTSPADLSKYIDVHGDNERVTEDDVLYKNTDELPLFDDMLTQEEGSLLTMPSTDDATER